MMVNNYSFRAKVISISGIEHFIRTTKPDIFKRILHLQLDNDNSIYAEIRNSHISKLAYEGIEENKDVEVEVEFQATQKDGKHYNNVVIKEIKLI